MMTKAQLITIAERNVKKAERAYGYNINRVGITEQEKENLTNNVEYSKIVRDLIHTTFTD
jgi:hypothetical protein